MIRTKQQADIHVATVLKQIKTEREKQLRGYTFAKLYFDIKEYDIAKRYLTSLFLVKNNSFEAYKLYAQILEYQKDFAKALDAYKRSLELNPLQNDILLKVGELYCKCNVPREVAQVWAEKIEKVYPSNEVVLRLKEKALVPDNGAGDNTESLLNLYKTESIANPTDTPRWIRLVQLYRKLGRLEEAYDVGIECEMRRVHRNSLAWYKCLVEVLEEYKQAKGKDVDVMYHRYYLSALDSLTSLSIEQCVNIADAVNALWSLDEALKRYICDAGATSVKEDWRTFLCEVEAQYWLHCATILLNKARKERLNWREASNLAAMCLLISYSVAAPDLSEAWYKRASPTHQTFYKHCYMSACHRLSQSGHVLNNLLKNHLIDESNDRWMERVREEYCNQQGISRLFSTLYTLPQHRDNRENSYLLKSTLVQTFQSVKPHESQLRDYDIVSMESRPDSLELVVWIVLQYYSVLDRTQPYQELPLFNKLQFDVSNLDSAGTESLSQLDVRAFLLATVRCAALRHEQRRQRFDAYRPHLLPLSINDKLCTDIQAEWWTCVHQLINNLVKEKLGKARSVLQRGIETVRLCGSTHGVDTSLIVHLALNFSEQLDAIRTSIDDEENPQQCSPEQLRVESRTLHYWNHAVELLERKSFSMMPKVRLFELPDGCDTLTDDEVRRYLNEGRMFQAMHHMDNGQLEKSLKLLSLVPTPDASFQLAMAYKQLMIQDQAVAASPRGGVTVELDEAGRSRQRTLLCKVRDSLCTTLDRLGGDQYHMLNARVAEEIDEVESRLRVLEEEAGGFSMNTVDGLNGETLPFSALSTPGMTSRSTAMLDRMRSNVNGAGGLDNMAHSTPLKPDMNNRNANSSFTSVNSSMMGGGGRFRPSPERLDAQIRSMAYSQEGVIKYLREELRDSRSTVQTLETRVTKLECKVEELMEQLRRLSAAPPAPPAATNLRGTPTHVTNLPQHLPLGMYPAQGALPARLVYPPPPMSENYNSGSPLPFVEGYYGGFPPHGGVPRHPPPPMMQPPPGSFYAYQSGVPVAPSSHPGSLRDPSVSARATASSMQDDYGDDDDYYDDDEEGNDYLQGEEAYTSLARCVDSGIRQGPPAGASIVTGRGMGSIQPSVVPQPVANLPTIKPGFFGTPAKETGVVASGESTLAALLTGKPTPGAVMPTSTAKPAAVSAATPSASSKLINLVANKNNCNQSASNTPPTFGQSTVTASTSVIKSPVVSTTPVSSTAVSSAGKTPLSFVAGAAKSPTGITFGTPSSGALRDLLNRSSVSDEGEGDMSNPDPHFEAIVTLPDNVELITGEEDERELFADRTKLYRFSDKQWKERGTGTIKILFNESNKKARVVMRRDQVHKVCANHYIRSDIEVEFKSPADKKVLTWRATDTSDGEPIIEQFCARFKTEDVAAVFMQKFKEAVELIGKDSTTSTPSAKVSDAKAPKSPEPVKTTTTKVKTPDAAKTPSALPASAASKSTPGGLFGVVEKGKEPDTKFSPVFGGKSVLAAPKFQSAAGTTTTSAPVMSFGGVTFSSSAVIQKTTDASKSGKEKETPSSKAANPFASFSFVKTTSATPGSTSGAASFTTPGASQNTAAGNKPVFGGSAGQPLFGTPAAVQPKTSTPATSSSNAETPLFGSGSTVSFASLAASGSSAEPKGFAVKVPESKTKGNMFQNAGQQLFSSSSPADKSVEKKNVHKKGKGKKDEEDEEEGGEEGEYEPSQEFTPVVNLPEVEVRTGEEGETKLFGERAKLYRMDQESKQWKERGVGELKIMKNPTTGTSRIIMRREQVLKLCANHRITATMKLMPLASSETSWLWYAQDYSEVDMKHEQLCARFKNVEQAKEFQKWFDKCVEEAANADTVNPGAEDTVVDGKSKEAAKESSSGSSGNAVPLSELFKPNLGDWECTACYVRNKPTSAVCASCTTPKPGAVAAKAPPPASVNVKPAVDSSKPSLGSLFKKEAGEWECTACYVKNKSDSVKCLACETVKPGAKPALPTAVDIKPAVDPSKPSLGSLFKKEAGEWECTACYVKNKPDSVKCLACETVKPGATLPVASVSDTKVNFGSQGGFTFGGSDGTMKFATGFGQSGAPTTGGFKFGSTSVPKSASSQSLSTEANQQPGFTGGFKFSSSGSFTFGAGKSADGTLNADSSTGQSSGGAKSTFSLGASPLLVSELTKKGNKEPVTTTASGFVFGSTPNPVFSFTPASAAQPSTVTSSAQPSTPKSNIGVDKFTLTPSTTSGGAVSRSAVETPGSPLDDSGLYRNSDGEDSHIHFEPVVKLPDKVDLSTGEEEEDVLCEVKGKLYRYCDNTWKERGVGVVKVLRRRVDGPGGRAGQCRLVMRREQVFKLCLNHLITADTKLHEMPKSDGKAWTWHADDYSEGQVTHESFAMRFKNAEIANEFKQAVESSVLGKEINGKPTSEQTKPDQPLTKTQPDDDVVEVKVEVPDAALVSKAREFKLPDTFYNYLTRPACRGCCGCEQNEDKFIFAAQPSSQTTDVKLTSATSSQSSSLSPTSIIKPSAMSLPTTTTASTTSMPLLSTSSSAVPSFGASAAFGGKPVFGVQSTASTATPIFGQSSASTATPIFGQSSSSTATPIFGQALGGSSMPSTKSQMVFGGASAGNVSFSSLAESGQPVFGGAKQNVTGGTAASGFTGPLFKDLSLSSTKKTEEVKPGTNAPVDLSSTIKKKSEDSTDNSKADSTVKTEQTETRTEDVANVQEEDDEEESPMFIKRATLFYVIDDNRRKVGLVDVVVVVEQKVGLVDVRISEDDDVSGLRIKMTSDTQDVHCSHIICRGYTLNRIDKRSCEWRAKDFRTDEGRQTVFYVEFSSPHATNEFEKCFNEGLKLAEQADICETKDENSSLYYNANQEQHDSGGESQ